MELFDEVFQFFDFSGETLDLFQDGEESGDFVLGDVRSRVVGGFAHVQRVLESGDRLLGAGEGA